MNPMIMAIVSLSIVCLGLLGSVSQGINSNTHHDELTIVAESMMNIKLYSTTPVGVLVATHPHRPIINTNEAKVLRVGTIRILSIICSTTTFCPL